METLEKLRKLLLPVFALGSIDDIQPEDSLVNALKADSLDFVEIVFLIEQNFGVSLKTSELIVGDMNPDDLFLDGKLTEEGAGVLKKNFPGDSDRFVAGISRIQMFSMITVADLARIIESKMK